MKKLSIILNSALITGTVALSCAPAIAALPIAVDNQELPSLAPMLSKVTPAVVLISVKGTQEVKQQIPDALKFFFDRRARPQQREFQGLGSGVIIDADKGYVLTNNHVIDKADEILITLKDGRQIAANKIGADADSDIALLQIDAEDLTAVMIADSDNLRVGDFAVAIGSPFGLGQTVTSGIISALGRSGLNIENYEDFIQTDAAINTGNSGGALVNLRGELIGINTAILGPNGGNVGIGFAIPSNMASNLVNQLIEFGEVQRGVLGVSGGSVNAEIAKAMELDINQGGFVEQVMSGSAAEKAGIEAGDVITKVNGKKVKSFNELRAKIGSMGAGAAVEITVIRANGNEKVFTVTLQKSEDVKIAAENIHRMFSGAEFENFNTNEGVNVNSLKPRSNAEMIGLKQGDIIQGVNKLKIDNIADLRNFFKTQNGVFALNVKRGHSNIFLMVR